MNSLDIINKYILENAKCGKLSKQRAIETLSMINNPKASSNIEWAVNKIGYEVFDSTRNYSIDEILTGINFITFLDKLADLLKSTGTAGMYPQIERTEEQEYYPLSSPQSRIYFANILDRTGISYNIPQIIHLEEDINIKHIEAMIRILIKRHEILRTSFKYIDGMPVQVVHRDTEFELEHISADNKNIKDIVREFVRPFDLNTVPLFRAAKLDLPEGKPVLLVDIHHIISDGYSLSNVLAKELSTLLRGESLPEPKLQYRDFSVWQRKLLDNGAFEKMKKYWLEVFSGELPVLNMPLNYPRPSVASFEGNYITFEIDKELKEKLKKLSAKNGATLYMTLLTVYYVLLSKYTGQEDIVVGSMSMGRRHKNLENMMGMFVNTLALRNYPEADRTFKQLLLEVKKSTLDAFDNEDFQYDELVRALGVKRDISRSPLFDTVFFMQSHIVSENNLMTRLEKKTSQFDITIEGLETKDEIKFSLEYSVSIYKKATMERLAKHFINIIKQVVEQDEVRLCDIDILSEAEKNQLLLEFNDTYTEYPKDKTIHRLFEEQAERTPNNIAVQFEGKTLTYRELNEKADRLAKVLRDKGVKSETTVGILVERSLEMIVGMIGILKAGGAYLPIDPQYPADRIKFMLEDSAVNLLLTNRELGNLLDMGIEKLRLEENWIYEENNTLLVDNSKPNNLAYVIYTSGSTGKPKGVAVEHQSVVNFIKAMPELLDFKEGDSMLCCTSVAFDIFGLETLVPLTMGMRIVVADEEAQRDLIKLSNMIKEEEINILQATPSRIQMLVGSKEARSSFGKLKTIIVGGETLPEVLLNELQKASRARLYNMYGPTETTIWSTAKEVTKEEKVTVGKPIANTKVYILGKNNKLQPLGVAGELCIAGYGLARGYINNMQLTEEKFPPDPFIHGARMYRTGDIARWLPDGSIELLGRTDNQVKIRGHRIELGEIENKLLSHADIKEAVVIEREDNSQNKYLCAYIVSEAELTVRGLREYLSKDLHEYMIPSYFHQLDKLPLTPNGKIDRKALPKPDETMKIGNEYAPPSNEGEAVLQEIWAKVLKTGRLGIDDDFFELGGDSFSLSQLQLLINERYPNIIKVQNLFDNRTIRKQAKLITDRTKPSTINDTETKQEIEILEF